MELQSIDISNAFLNGVLAVPVYMKQPEGFDTNPELVCKLNKTLYGLKQAPKEWYVVLSEALQGFGLTQSHNDLSLWTDDNTYVLHWVDDLIIATTTMKRMNELKRQLLTKFKGRDLGEATSYLNMKIERDRVKRTIKIT